MDVQSFFNSMNEMSKRERSNYHLCLGDLIQQLEKMRPEVVVQFDAGGYPQDPHSFRGHYSDLALEPGKQPVTAEVVLRELKQVIDTELEGYKGGDFLMDAKAPLWMAEYGRCGPAIIDLKHDAGSAVAYLVTKEIED